MKKKFELSDILEAVVVGAACWLAIASFGCGEQLRITTLDAHQLAIKTEQSVARDLVGAVGRTRLLLAKERLKTAPAANVNAELDSYANDMEKVRWLSVQFERACGIDIFVVNDYIRTRKSWVKVIFDDGRKAFDAAKKSVAEP